MEQDQSEQIVKTSLTKTCLHGILITRIVRLSFIQVLWLKI